MPLFYYLGHFTLIHVIAALVCQVRYGTMWYMFDVAGPRELPVHRAAWLGLFAPAGLRVVDYVVVALYLPCRWFAGVKARRRDWWLGYL